VFGALVSRGGKEPPVFLPRTNGGGVEPAVNCARNCWTVCQEKLEFAPGARGGPGGAIHALGFPLEGPPLKAGAPHGLGFLDRVSDRVFPARMIRRNFVLFSSEDTNQVVVCLFFQLAFVAVTPHCPFGLGRTLFCPAGRLGLTNHPG